MEEPNECTKERCIRDSRYSEYAWLDEDGYFRCNSWLCSELHDGKKCYIWHSSLANCLEEFTAEYKWYKNITWTELFHHIRVNTDSQDEFCDCYHIINIALAKLPADAKDEDVNIFTGIPVHITSEYMDIKASYLTQLDALTSLVDNNPPNKVAFVLSGQIMANEVYYLNKYSVLHYTPYTTSVSFAPTRPMPTLQKEQ